LDHLQVKRGHSAEKAFNGKAAAKTQRVISDWELWACANKLVEQHGRDAPKEAFERRLELEGQGDETGAQVWALIAERSVQLLREPKQGEQRQ
jgi:hypothetical protein